jgi:putative nucleotidyltransferase with HDIG domain
MDFALAHALSQAAVFHDLPTAAHNWRVTMYAQAFAEVVELGSTDTNRFMMAALLHDLGKIDVPHALLTKTGPLDEREFEALKQHTCHGFERLRRMGEEDEVILSVVRWHHERLDGSGYPDGLAGAEIPAAARFFAVIDAFDAMTSLRTYRPEQPLRTSEEALEELARDAGRILCPDSTGVMIRLHAEGRLEPIRSHLNDREALADLEISAASEACAQARLLLRASTPSGMPDISHLLNARAG